MKAFIKTYGCQMNKYTSSVYEAELQGIGYEMTNNENEADIIILNTCSVRKHAEDRVFGKLSSLLFLKRNNKNLKIGIVGCMAKRLSNKLFEMFPSLSFVIGPNDVGKIKEAILKEKSCSVSEDFPNFSPPCQRETKAYLPISFGCSNYCSYCIVPYTWGGLKNRKRDEILQECESLLKNGVSEITLLGQDITSYKDNSIGLADILDAVAKMGFPRIRFLTSHPLRMDDRIIATIANNKNISPSFHIPLQSGSDKILKAMNRGYSFEYYQRLVEKIREKIPLSSITTDIIVGFPGETEEDYKKTQDALKTIEFDSAFLFKYSPREGTEAAKLKEALSEDEKIERLQNLIKIANEISCKKNKESIGKTFNVLVSEINPRDEKSLIGRTETDKVVVFEGENSLLGKVVPVIIKDVSTYTLKGEIVSYKNERQNRMD